MICEPNGAQRRFLESMFDFSRGCVEWRRDREDISTYMFTAGYGTGKSYFDVMLIMCLMEMYRGKEVTIGVGSSTMKRLRQSLLLDLHRVLRASGVKYTYNIQEGEMHIGEMTIMILNLEQYEDIYAINVNMAIMDELDTLPSEKAVGAFTKCSERCRKVFPDGHEPVKVVSSTANGLKGLYRLYTGFKGMAREGRGVPFVLVRGETYENPYFARSALRDLEALYTESEREAYLRGKFVNLSSGRVYPEFDKGVHVWSEFRVREDDVIYCGADANAGYNTNEVVVERGGKLYVVEEFKCDVAGDVARELRGRYPGNKLVMVPDASSKEILRGYMEEIEEAGVEIRFMVKNPGIMERVLVVNKLLRMGRLGVFGRCKKLVTALEMRGFNERGEPEKGRGEGALDHGCDALEYVLYYIVHSRDGFKELLNLLRFQGGGGEMKVMDMGAWKGYSNWKAAREKRHVGKVEARERGGGMIRTGYDEREDGAI